MPGLNHKGPTGQGPMTGRRMGRCTNFGTNLKKHPETDNEIPENKITENPSESMPGRGMGMGRGFGRGRGRGLGRQNRFRGGQSSIDS